MVSKLALLRNGGSARRTRSTAPRVEVLEDRLLLSGKAASPLGPSFLDVDPHAYDLSSILIRLRPEALGLAHPSVPGTEVAASLPLVAGLQQIRLGEGISVEAALAAYQANPMILYAEPNYRVRLNLTPNDTQFSALWGLDNTGQTGGTVDADVDAPRAWDVTTGTGNTIVAVIDTGVDYNHPDLAANIWTNGDEIAGNGIDDDLNGFVDDVHGYDFVNNDGDPLDDHGHGTHVAGTIGAVSNNGMGVTGLNWHVQIMALKFLDSGGGGFTSAAISSLNYAVAQGAGISNNSWGGGGFSQSLYDAILNARNAGHIFAAAAGNSSSDNDEVPFYPASYDLDNIIAVAATDDNDDLASFSNYGATTVHLGAPGVSILSTVPAGGGPLGDPTGYRYLSGTSMATPHVAGVVALVRDLNPTWTYAQVIDQILSTVDPLTSLQTITLSGGRLNAAAALGNPEPDLTGPRVIASNPSNVSGSISSLRVTFQEPLDASTFTTADIVSFSGPNGAISVTSVGVVNGSTNRQFDVTFPTQSDLGAYSMVIGPDIYDVVGNPMNQDGDGTNGEVPADRYTATFTISDALVFSSTDVPAPILELTATGSFLHIDQDVTISDLNVQLNITHTYDSDLLIYLIAPSGNYSILSEFRGGDGDDFDDTIFDDEAAVSIGAGSAPFAGSYRPETPLAFDGENARGTWELWIEDWGIIDEGTLHAWSLILQTPSTTTAQLSISAASVTEGNSGTVSAIFTVTLSAPASQTVTVTYATADGTATTPADYTAIPSTPLSFDPGETSKTVTVAIQGDALNEAHDTFFVNLSNAINATIADATGVGTIVNDDPLPTISLTDVSSVEGNSGTKTFSFTATLSAASGRTVTVNYATADGTGTAGSDYVAKTGSLTFSAGQTSKTITVTVNGDSSREADETFWMALNGETHAIVADSLGLGRILNDDASLVISDASVVEGQSGTANATFTVTLSAAMPVDVSVNYTTAKGPSPAATSGSDFVSASGVLSFASGQTSKTITVLVLGDTRDEPGERFVVNLSSAANALIADTQGLGTINDDDAAPNVTISDAIAAEGNAGTKNLGFVVSLTAASGQTITVQYALANGTATGGTDYTGGSGTLTFSAGQISKTLNVVIKGDTAVEPDETFVVNLVSATNANLTDHQGIGTLLNDDPNPLLFISDAQVTEGNSGTRNITFAVTLSAASGSAVTVQYATADNTSTAVSDYLAKTGTLTFSVGQTKKTFTVVVNADVVLEPDESFFVNLSAPTNAAIGDSQALGKILNDDANLVIGDVSVVEGQSGVVNATFTVTLSAAMPVDVSVSYATANGTTPAATAGTDYVSVSGILIFAPGVTTRTITVLVSGDLRDEPSEKFVVNLTGPANAVTADAQGVGTINDDDPAPNMFISDAIVAEGNAGAKSMTFTVKLSEPSGQTVTVQYATANGTAMAGSDYTAVSGTLTFTAGQTTKIVTVLINGDTAPEQDETLLVNLSNSSNALLADNQGSGTILNDDEGPAGATFAQDGKTPTRSSTAPSQGLDPDARRQSDSSWALGNVVQQVALYKLPETEGARVSNTPARESGGFRHDIRGACSSVAADRTCLSMSPTAGLGEPAAIKRPVVSSAVFNAIFTDSIDWTDKELRELSLLGLGIGRRRPHQQ